MVFCKMVNLQIKHSIQPEMRMLSMIIEKSYDEVIWYDYEKLVLILEKYANNISH